MDRTVKNCNTIKLMSYLRKEKRSREGLEVVKSLAMCQKHSAEMRLGRALVAFNSHIRNVFDDTFLTKKLDAIEIGALGDEFNEFYNELSAMLVIDSYTDGCLE